MLLRIIFFFFGVCLCVCVRTTPLTTISVLLSVAKAIEPWQRYAWQVMWPISHWTAVEEPGQQKWPRVTRGPCQKRLEWYTGPWGLVTLASAPFEVFHLHTSHAGAFLPSVLCRVRERHTDSYFIWGGGGRVHSGQVDTNEQIKTDHSGRLL